jgi:glycerol-3-phosphate dehydrogenase
VYTVIIIGGGVVGSLIARELSRYNCRILLLEKENDVACGASKANSGIVHAGFDAEAGTQKAAFNAAGNIIMERVCEELGVHFRKNGSMVCAFNDYERESQAQLLKQGAANNVKGLSIISGDQARELEPALSDNVKSVLLAQTGGIVCPYNLAINAASNAEQNGLDLRLNEEVISIIKENHKFIVSTTGHEYTAKYVINAAGLFADKIAAMVGDSSFSIIPRAGEYMLFDKSMGGLVGRTIFQMPQKSMGKGVLVTPTVDGNLLIGPSAVNLSADNETIHDTTTDGQDFVWRTALKSVPGINHSGLITSFTGIRAVSDSDDFIVGESNTTPGFYNAAGIQSPGLTASPAIGEYLARLIVKAENLSKNSDFYPYFHSHPSILESMELSKAELDALIKEDPSYGNIICRCETVSEGHILDALRQKCPATDIDGVKRRTRAGMGRCQGGFCMPKVLEIIARQTGKEFTEINKKGDGSLILSGKRK